MKRILVTLAFLLAVLYSAVAQKDTLPKEEDEMNVDLPDETQETDLVKKGQLQLETAVLYNTYREEKASLIGQGLLRYGVSRFLEVRLLAEDGRQRDTYITSTVQSTYPLAAGAKVRLLKDKKGLPDMALVSYVKLPFTSHTKVQQRYWSPIFLVAFQNEWGEKWKLEYNAGIQQEAYGTSWAWLGNVSLHYKLLKPLELSVEYFAQYQPKESPQHNIGGGLVYELGKSVTIYATVGSTIFYSGRNHFVSTGIAVRLPE